MKELIDVFKDNNILILAIIILILGFVLLGYLLTSLLFTKKVKKCETKNQAVAPNCDNTNKKTLDLEQMLGKMQESLDKKEQMDKVSKYENDQEENAIISYQELLKAAKKDFPQMSTQSTEKKSDSSNEVLKPEVLDVDATKEEKKFKNSVFISPIYGTKGNYAESSSNQSSVSVSLNKDSLQYENEMNEQFLDDLKKFRNNL